MVSNPKYLGCKILINYNPMTTANLLSCYTRTLRGIESRPDMFPRSPTFRSSFPTGHSCPFRILLPSLLSSYFPDGQKATRPCLAIFRLSLPGRDRTCIASLWSWVRGITCQLWKAQCPTKLSSSKGLQRRVHLT